MARNLVIAAAVARPFALAREAAAGFVLRARSAARAAEDAARDAVAALLFAVLAVRVSTFFALRLAEAARRAAALVATAV